MLEKIGYNYFPYRKREMHWFCKPSMEHREYHVHLVTYNGKTWKERLAFRNYLRTHPDTRQEYEALKKSLAQTYRDDREAYTESKTRFIRLVVAKARYGKVP